MIKDLNHATLVQERRRKSGKRGHAKAVRRYLRRKHILDYSGLKRKLLAIWPEKAEDFQE